MKKKSSSLALAGLIFSLVFFIPTFSIIGMICGIVAVGFTALSGIGTLAN